MKYLDRYSLISFSMGFMLVDVINGKYFEKIVPLILLLIFFILHIKAEWGK